MTSAKILNILQKYNDQLSRTKRAVVFKKALKIKESSEDKVTLSKEGRRRELIDKLSREIINNLVVSDEPTGIAMEIKGEVEEEVGMRLLFEFDPKEKSIIIRREDKTRLSPIQQKEIVGILKKVTREKLEKIVS